MVVKPGSVTPNDAQSRENVIPAGKAGVGNSIPPIALSGIGEDDTSQSKVQAQVKPDPASPPQTEPDVQVTKKSIWNLSYAQWKITLKSGKEIKFADQIDRIVSFVNVIQAVGSAAASLDPVHAGLAWAGVSVLLPVNWITLATWI